MKRTLYRELLQWKQSDGRKPLIINGARQVGKTWLLREFGQREYKKLAMVSLDRDPRAAMVFSQGQTVADMLLALSALTGVDITPDDTLLVLDEVQACPRALEALKYFCEDAPEIHVAVAGSLLGLSLHGGASFPVGKVDELRLYPMSFLEFLDAMDRGQLANVLRHLRWPVLAMLWGELESLLRQYYYVGGMPEAVLAHTQGRGLQAVRHIQQQILSGYRRDFSKHTPLRETPRINQVWDAMPSQLAKENKKFVYGAVKKGARAADFELAIQWLVDAGLAYKCFRVSAPRVPLKFYEDLDAFKLFPTDVGLLGAMAGTESADMLIGSGVFSEYKGAFTELYVYTQLRAAGLSPYYHTAVGSTVEIDFIVQHAGRVIPIEVKAEANVRSKSLRTFVSAHPELHAIRFSMLPYQDQEWMENLPLAACGAWAEALLTGC